MENKTTLAILTILMISSVAALYAGESISIVLEEDFEYYSIVGNQSPVDITIIQDGLNLIITPDKYMKNETFSIIFFNKEKETIPQIVYRGGGGGGSTRIKYVDRNVTKYIPIYDNITNEVEVIKEVETIIDNTEPGLELWHFLLIIAIAIIIGISTGRIIGKVRKEEKPFYSN